MPVKAEHAPYLVHVGQQVMFTMSQDDTGALAGKLGVVIAKGPMCVAADTRPFKEAMDNIAYYVRVAPPAPGFPSAVWCWRCGFEVKR